MHTHLQDDWIAALYENAACSEEEVFGTDHVPVVCISTERGPKCYLSEINRDTPWEAFGLIDLGNNKPTLGSVDLEDLFDEEMGYGAVKVWRYTGELVLSELSKKATAASKVEF